jgi:hypothetical protein
MTDKEKAVKRFEEANARLTKVMPNLKSSSSTMYLPDSVNVTNLPFNNIEAINSARTKISNTMRDIMNTRKMSQNEDSLEEFVLKWLDTALTIAKTGFDVVSVSGGG